MDGPLRSPGRLGSVWLSPALHRESNVPTWTGVGVAGLGFGLLVWCWGRVAGETNVAFQLPYVVSSGLGGLGLIVVGLTVIAVQAKRHDAAARDRALSQLLSQLDELAQRVNEPRRRVPRERAL